MNTIEERVEAITHRFAEQGFYMEYVKIEDVVALVKSEVIKALEEVRNDLKEIMETESADTYEDGYEAGINFAASLILSNYLPKYQ